MNFTDLLQKGLIGPLTGPAPKPAGFPYGLGAAGLHEVAGAAHDDSAPATGFILAASAMHHTGLWLWVRQQRLALETGHLSETGLAQSIRKVPPQLGVTARRDSEALWATEEAIVSGAVSHVIAEVSQADFTATRRLALAAHRYGVPVTLLLPYTCSGATAAATRWRISARPSAPNRYDPQAPGHPRWRAVLERCRAAPAAAGQAFDLEWNDETLSLRMADTLAAGQAAPRPAAAPPALRRKAG